jgi:hypothetical protein
MVKIGLGLCALAGVLCGCNVDSPPETTGGVDFDAGDGALVDSGTDAPDAPSCERGVAVVTSDYRSTNVAIAHLDGTTVSPSFISSGATKPGLSLALSGDVDIPRIPPRSGRVVLLDRYGTNVVTWMKLETAEVIAQLPVGQGFESNPQDYIEVDDHRAYVSRYATNPNPGKETFDEGGDLLIVDTIKPSIEGRIAMPEDDPSLAPCPSGLTQVGDTVVATLIRWAPDFSKIGEGRFVGVSPATNSVVWTVDVKGLYSCGRVAISPSGAHLAIACSSRMADETGKNDPATSDIVIYDAHTSPPTEIRRLGLGTKLDAGIQPDLAFGTENVILAKTFGGNATAGDTVFAVDVTNSTVTPLGDSPQAYALYGMHCAPGCGDICLLADSERNKLRRWKVSAAVVFDPLDDVVVDTVVGLPPRALGGL